MKIKNLTLISSYCSDVTLIAWIYFQATSYKNYSVHLAKKLESPDFQVQIYYILMQSLTFALLLFLVAQSAIYIMAWRKFKSAFTYLKFFSVMGFAISLLITFIKSPYAILPACLYVFGYYQFSKSAQELSVIKQTPPQSAIQ